MKPDDFVEAERQLHLEAMSLGTKGLSFRLATPAGLADHRARGKFRSCVRIWSLEVRPYLATAPS
jgi:hypothetical protein